MFLTSGYTATRMLSYAYLWLQKGEITAFSFMAAELTLFMVALKLLNGNFRTWHMLQGSSLYIGPPAIRLIEWMTTSMAPNIMFRCPCSVGGALFTGWIFLSWLMNFAMLWYAGMDSEAWTLVGKTIFIAGNVLFVVFLCIFLLLVKKEYFRTFTTLEGPYEYMYKNFWQGAGLGGEKKHGSPGRNARMSSKLTQKEIKVRGRRMCRDELGRDTRATKGFHC